MTRWRRAPIWTACVVLWAASSSANAGQAQSAHRSAAPNGADAAVREYRLRALDATVQSLPPGPARLAASAGCDRTGMTWDGPVRVPMSRNPIGSVTSAITANGKSEQWLLDTGANYSVVSRSFAQTLGLTPLTGSAMVGSGVTGLASRLQAAVLPDLHLGGATVQHAVAMILDDASLRIGSGPTAYQIHAILGYPVLKALGRITFTRNGEFLAGEAAEKASGVPMYMRGLSPAIECDVAGQKLLFTFDTGASSTDFSVRYFNLFRQLHGTWQTRIVESGGAGGTVRRKMYIQPDVVLKVGDAAATLKDVTIFPTPTHAGIDVLFGNIGQDLVAGFESFTLDFVGMTFGLGPPSTR